MLHKQVHARRFPPGSVHGEQHAQVAHHRRHERQAQHGDLELGHLLVTSERVGVVSLQLLRKVRAIGAVLVRGIAGAHRGERHGHRFSSGRTEVSARLCLTVTLLQRVRDNREEFTG